MVRNDIHGALQDETRNEMSLSTLFTGAVEQILLLVLLVKC